MKFANILLRIYLLAMLMLASFTLGRALAPKTYAGPPVAAFTTGGQSCSPICGKVHP